MSEGRRYARVLLDLDVTFFGPGGEVLDELAQASDVSPVGFRAQTRVEVKPGDRLRFSMKLENGEDIGGTAQAVWVNKDGWGTVTAGFKFARLSWRARRLLRETVPQRRFDFVGLAKKAVTAIYWAVLVAAAHNIAFHQPQLRATMLQLVPVTAAAALLAFGIFLLVW